MSDIGLRDYYEQELRYLREAGNEFGEAHSDIAGRLRFKGGDADDPHVERLLQGFAFLAARVHARIDDDFSEICQALLNLVYPHYLRPIPSFSIVEFEPDKGAPTAGFKIPAGASLVSPPADGVRCRFRTCYDTEVWPLRVTDAAWQSARGSGTASRGADVSALLRVRLETAEQQDLSALEIDSLRFHLAGDLPMVSELFELLDNNCAGVLFRDVRGDGTLKPLPDARLRPIGFSVSETLLPSPGRAFHAYQLLLEYFAFPKKFMFLELEGLEALRQSNLGDSVELLFQIRSFPGSERQEMLERSVNAGTVRLGCSPVVNLFPLEERLRLNERQTEHLLRDQLPKGYPYRIFSVDEVTAITSDTSMRVPMSPLFSHRHRRGESDTGLFWHARRHASGWMGKDKTDVSLAFVDLRGKTIRPKYPTVVADITAFNGTLPNDVIPITQAGEEGVLELETGGAPVRRIHVLERPTLPIEPALDGSFLWSLVSQLSLNYLSLIENDGQGLRELLRLYNFGRSEAGEEHVRGIAHVRTEPMYARVRGEHGVSFARGKKVQIEFEQERFPTGGIYLFASVIERFLALYATMNSFSALAADVRSKDQRYSLREWPPRAGERTLI